MARDHVNYDYYESKLLNQDYCMHKTTGEVIFQDGTRYSQDEIILLNKLKKNPKILTDRKAEIIKNLHQLKKEFHGAITSDMIEKEISKSESSSIM